MAIGILNPKDAVATVAGRPAHVNSAVSERRWATNAGDGSDFDAQDWNALVAQVRALGDYFGIGDTEGDDDYLRKAVQAAVAPAAAGSRHPRAYGQRLLRRQRRTVGRTYD